MQTEKMLSVRLPAELAGRLEALTKATGHTESAITLEALRGYVDTQTWQIAEIQAGVEEADRGEFATEAEVAALFAKYGA